MVNGFFARPFTLEREYIAPGNRPKQLEARWASNFFIAEAAVKKTFVAALSWRLGK